MFVAKSISHEFKVFFFVDSHFTGENIPFIRQLKFVNGPNVVDGNIEVIEAYSVKIFYLILKDHVTLWKKTFLKQRQKYEFLHCNRWKNVTMISGSESLIE